MRDFSILQISVSLERSGPRKTGTMVQIVRCLLKVQSHSGTGRRSKAKGCKRA